MPRRAQNTSRSPSSCRDRPVTGGQHNFWDEIADDENLTISELSAMLAEVKPPAGDFGPRPFIEEMTASGLWLHGDQDRIIPARASAQIVMDVAEEFGRPFTVTVIRTVTMVCATSTAAAAMRIYWADLLPWPGSVIR